MMMQNFLLRLIIIEVFWRMFLLKKCFNYLADNERSLLVLAHCLTQARGYESAYHLLRTVSNPTAGAALNTAKCRYLFAHCAFMLNRLFYYLNFWNLYDIGMLI